MRIVFCGTPESAVPSLKRLAAQPAPWEVAAVLTQPDRPVGRGRKTMPSPVRIAAETLGVRVLTPDKPKHVRAELEEIAPDVIAVVAYGHIFRRWLLELPRLGCVNVHFSLLPRHRGVAPVTWAILEGDAETGVTTMRMDRGVDTGPTFLTDRTPITAEDTTASLTGRLAELGASLLVRTLREVEAGTLASAPQPEEGATYARALRKEDGRIDWSAPAAAIERRVRALSPWPGTFTGWRGRRFKVHRAAVVPSPHDGTPAPAGVPGPGETGSAGERLVVGTGRGLLELVTVQPEGKPSMSGEAWARGARPQPGETFMDPQ